MRQHIGGEACLGAASIHLAHDGCQRAAPDPVAASLVADQMTPAAGARGRARRVAAVRDRSGSRDDDDARPHARAGHQRDQRVVDDEQAPTRTDPAHDRTNNPRVVLTVNAGDPDADCRRLDGAIAERGLDDAVEHLLDFELPRRLDVRARSPTFRDDRSFPVGEKTYRLRAAGIDAEDMHASQILCYPAIFHAGSDAPAELSCLEFMPRSAHPIGLRRLVVAVVALLTTLAPLHRCGVRAAGEVKGRIFSTQ